MGKKEEQRRKDKAFDELKKAATDKVPYGSPFVLIWMDEDGMMHMDAHCTTNMIGFAAQILEDYTNATD